MKEGAGWKFPYSWIINPSRILVWLILAIAMAYSINCPRKDYFFFFFHPASVLFCCPSFVKHLLKQMGSQDSQRLVHYRCKIVTRKKDNILYCLPTFCHNSTFGTHPWMTSSYPPKAISSVGVPMLAVTPSMHESTDPAIFLAAYIFAKTLY